MRAPGRHFMKGEEKMFSIKNQWFSVTVALLLLLLPAGKAFSQTVTGTISGVVVDSSGAIMAGGAVRGIQQQKKIVRPPPPTQTGESNSSACPPATYTPKSEK